MICFTYLETKQTYIKFNVLANFEFDLIWVLRLDYFTHFEPVSHVTRARLEPTAARWRAKGAKD